MDDGYLGSGGKAERQNMVDGRPGGGGDPTLARFAGSAASSKFLVLSDYSPGMPVGVKGEDVQRPVSITLFAALFGFATVVSMLLAAYAARTTHFGFTLPPDAAQTLITRVLTIRLVGIGFALSLMLLVVFGKSSAARGALGLRWFLGLATSIAFLRGIGVITPTGASGMAAATALSIIQLSAEGFAILILYGGDAAPWFERGFRY